jgi:hypothetical protein
MQERLDASSEADEVARCTCFYLIVAEGQTPGLAGPEQQAWVARLNLGRIYCSRTMV